jgi:hypothetical protein
MTKNYKIVISGNEILFDNYGSPEPVIGFIACREVEAESEEMAIATVKRNILVQWNQSFNADRKIGLPKLIIEQITPIRKLFRRRARHDYYFFVSEETKKQHLEKFTKVKSWWRFGKATS